MNLPNPATWNWTQDKAAGKHLLSYAAGATTAAAFMGLISQGDSASLMSGLNQIVDGLESAAKGVGVVAGVLIPIYTALRAAHNASPQEQIKSVVNNLSAPEVTQVANAVVDPQGRAKLINAVAEMPEVKGIVAAPAVALVTPSDKVVATVGEIKAPSEASPRA